VKGFNMRNKQKILKWLLEKNTKITKLIYKFYEPLTYLFFGVLTTLVNISIYTLLEQVFGQENWYISNLPAIFLAILFAYITNRSFVFDSTGNFWAEMYRFFSARIFISLIGEYGMTYILFNVLEIDYQLNFGLFSISIFKILSQIIVIVGNYVASKIYVFKTGKKS
jgi:putative flippase GtrA